MSTVTSYLPTTVSGTVTSWLPLTSVWTAPPICSSIVWEGYPPLQVINDPAYGVFVDSGPQCLPPAVTTWWEQDNAQVYTRVNTHEGSAVFSIGPIVCPQAYTTGYTSEKDSSTFVACCPSNYDFEYVKTVGYVGQCVSTPSIGQAISLVTWGTIANSNVFASAWVTTLSTATEGAVIYGIQVNGWNFVPATSTPPPLSTTTSSKPTSVPSTNTNNNSRNIGIGVGVSLGTIGILSLCFAFWIVRRRRSKVQGSFGHQTGSETLPTNDKRNSYSVPVHEIGSSKFPHGVEIYSTPHGTHPAELETRR